MVKSKFAKILGISFTLALVASLLLSAVPAQALTGTIGIFPISGPVNTNVTVTASGFTPDETYYIQFSGVSIKTGNTGIGDFTTNFSVPIYPRGAYPITVTTTAPDTSNTVYYTVTPMISLSTLSGYIGDVVTATGAGFKASSTVTIYFDTTAVKTVTTTSSGTFSNISFSVPDVSGGSHMVKGTDASGDSPCINFLVLTTPNGYTITQLTDNAYDDFWPQIDSGQIVWFSYDGTDYEVFLWKDGVTTQLTGNDYDDFYPQIDAGQVVWLGYDGTDDEIFFWKDGVTTQLTDNNYDECDPRINAGQIVWYSHDGTDFETFLWKDGVTTQLTDNDYYDIYPQIDAGQIVWFGTLSTIKEEFEVFIWENGVTTQLTDNDNDDFYPQIDAGQVVWYGYDGADDEIFLWKDGVTTQLTDNDYDDYAPQIDAGQVVWLGYDGTDFESFLWKDGVTTQLTDNDYNNDVPQIDAGQVVWCGNDGTKVEIFFWKDGVTTQITDNNYSDYCPQIDTGQVVWYGYDGTDFEIFMIEPKPQNPELMINNLIFDVIELNLSYGIENSLIASLEAAMKSIIDSNPSNDMSAINNLQAFINKVEAQHGKKVFEYMADELIAKAQDIIVVLCKRI